MSPLAMQPHPQSEHERRQLGGALMQGYLAGRHLPALLPGEPSGMAAFHIASALCDEFVETLAQIYDVDRWTLAEYRRAFVQGALAGWRPGSFAQEAPGRLMVVSPVCPVAAEAEIDARVCQTCRVFQERATRAMLPGRVASVEFSRLITRGDSSCAMDVRLRQEG